MSKISVPGAVRQKSTSVQKVTFFRNEENNFFFSLVLRNGWFQGKLAHHHIHERVNFIFSSERQHHINCYMVFTQQQCFVGWNLNDPDGWKLQNEAVVRKSSDSDAKM